MSGIEVAAAVVGAVAAVGSAVMSVGAANNQAAYAEANSNYQRQVAERDQAIAEQNRQYALEQGRIASEDAAREERRKLSAIRTAYGASGVDLTGSPLEVLTDSAYEGALDVSRTEYKGKIDARNAELQKLGLEDTKAYAALESSYASSQARSATAAGMLNIAGSLASGASKVYKAGAKAKYWG